MPPPKRTAGEFQPLPFSDDELELLLKVLQETHFVDWPSKLLAGQVQQRVDAELKHRSPSIQS